MSEWIADKQILIGSLAIVLTGLAFVLAPVFI